MKRIRTWIGAHRGATAAIVVAAVAIGGFGVYWFGPQKLFIDERVDEALPGDAQAAEPQATEDGTAQDQGTEGEDEAKAAGQEVRAEGEFRSLEHESTGTAQILELEDGRTYLRFEDLDVLNGPDLRVYLAVAPADADGGAFGEDFVDLGGLKGNQGNQNYLIPDDVDVSEYRSVAVWCRRFGVGFGVAPLDPVK